MDKSSAEQTKTPMTQDAASRIQSHADRTGTNQGFKSSAQSAADKNAKQGKK
ncbi:hypothetical protein BJV82DRAFT_663866 [Fennellomyces sp. T-0311]|nr:hypothetical protein BJV82DRAFT_663866 [Fennellomyces sp. T-0311]